MAKELQGEQNLESESDEGNRCPLLQIKKPFEAVETESHPVFIPLLVVDETSPSVDDISQFYELYWPTKAEQLQGKQKLERKRDERNSSILALVIQMFFATFCRYFIPPFTPYCSRDPAFDSDFHGSLAPRFAVSTLFHHPDLVTSQPGITFIMRQRTNLKESKELLRQPDEEIAEGDAVCENCWIPFKANEAMVKMKCKCKNQLFHEACVAIKSNCATCEQQVQRIPLTLLERRCPDDAGVTTQNGKKHKWFSIFKW